MKSEKAKEFINKYAVGNSRDAAPSMMKNRVIECVELAEQEAEERIRDKAIQAHCEICEIYEVCKKSRSTCHGKDVFIQKLNEV